MKFSPRHAAAAAVLALLAACGGGGSQVDPFEPRRLLAFGDENSLLTTDGRRYAINAVNQINGQQVVDCAANPIWLQTLADGFGLVLAACNPSNRTPTSTIYARPSARVADVRAQIDQHFSGGTVGPRDLITVFAGLHDILELYTQFPAQAQTQLLAAAGARGRELAQQVNRLANANGRIIVLTVPPAKCWSICARTSATRAPARAYRVLVGVVFVGLQAASTRPKPLATVCSQIGLAPQSMRRSVPTVTTPFTP